MTVLPLNSTQLDFSAFEKVPFLHDLFYKNHEPDAFKLVIMIEIYSIARRIGLLPGKEPLNLLSVNDSVVRDCNSSRRSAMVDLQPR